MMLQYPKITPSLSIAQYADYLKLHHEFMHCYKVLYEDVAGFALLPEKFINDADPVIQQFADKLHNADASAMDKLRMQVITDFIERFYVFMDKAAEMFTEHQALAEQAVHYMHELSNLKKLAVERSREDMEEEYVQLIPQLEKMNETLKQVKEKVAFSKAELNKLLPIWEQIMERMEPAIMHSATS